jgi:hypothetical protein
MPSKPTLFLRVGKGNANTFRFSTNSESVSQIGNQGAQTTDDPHGPFFLWELAGQ